MEQHDRAGEPSSPALFQKGDRVRATVDVRDDGDSFYEGERWARVGDLGTVIGVSHLGHTQGWGYHVQFDDNGPYGLFDDADVAKHGRLGIERAENPAAGLLRGLFSAGLLAVGVVGIIQGLRARGTTAAVLLVALVCLTGCTHAQLEGTGDKMVRIERATTGVVDGVVAFKDVTKEDCIAQNLATEAERAKCVEKALAAVKASKVGVATVRAALVTFWELYPILDRKLAEGGRLSADDLAELASLATAVVEAYQTLIKEVQEAKR